MCFFYIFTGQAKFGGKFTRIVTADDGTEIEEDEVLIMLSNKLLMLLKDGEDWEEEVGIDDSSTARRTPSATVAGTGTTSGAATTMSTTPGMAAVNGSIPGMTPVMRTTPLMTAPTGTMPGMTATNGTTAPMGIYPGMTAAMGAMPAMTSATGREAGMTQREGSSMSSHNGLDQNQFQNQVRNISKQS